MLVQKYLFAYSSDNSHIPNFFVSNLLSTWFYLYETLHLQLKLTARNINS